MALACPGLRPANCQSHCDHGSHRHGRRTFPIYNVEMVEVTGGRFWKPYGSTLRMYIRIYTRTARRIDLTNARYEARGAVGACLRSCQRNLGKRHLFCGFGQPAVRAAPWFNGMSDHQQWRGVFNFSQAVGAQIVTSFAIARNPRCDASLDPDQARHFSPIPTRSGALRSRGVHERTQPCRRWAARDRLRRERIWKGLQDISLVIEATTPKR